MEFRKVPSLDLTYEVSEDGAILRRVKDKHVIKMRIKSEKRSKARYLETRVTINGERRHVYIHQLVAECWLGQRPGGMVIDHRNRISTDNRWENLRYVTISENIRNR